MKRVGDPAYLPPGRNFRWHPKKEALEKVIKMMHADDFEMKALGVKLFYQIQKIWEEDKEDSFVRMFKMGRPPKKFPYNWTKHHIAAIRVDILKKRMKL